MALEHSCRTRQELADRCGDFARVGFKSEMPGVEEANRSLGYIAPERLGTGRQKEGIVLSPCGQERRPLGAKVVLKLRVQGDVALVVTEQVQLHFGHASAA